jgi:tetratricopeptide (TPR) repeat protein
MTKSISKLEAVVSVILFLILSMVVRERNHVWSSEITFWTDIAGKSPGKARAYNNLGSALLNIGRYDESKHSLQLAIKADQWYIEPHFNMAVCYIKQGRYDEAVPELEKVLSINVVLKKGHYGAKAQPRYEMQAHTNLGNIYNVKGMLDRAISHYTEALRIAPKDASTRFNLALTYKRMGNMSKAKAEFEEVLRLNPEDEGARRNLQQLQR